MDNEILRLAASQDPRYLKHLNRALSESADPLPRPLAFDPDGKPIPCRYIGPRVYKAGSVRDWHRCDHPQRVELGIPQPVCTCKGCHSGCNGYVAEESLS